VARSRPTEAREAGIWAGSDTQTVRASALYRLAAALVAGLLTLRIATMEPAGAGRRAAAEPEAAGSSQATRHRNSSRILQLL
jgi:hypothetical protein